MIKRKTDKSPKGKAVSTARAETLPSTESEVEASQAPLMDHLMELRARLIKCVLAVILGCVICIPFLNDIITLLMWPFEIALERFNVDLTAKGRPAIDLELISTYPLETFFAKLKVALFGGIVLGFPVIAYQLYRFVAPGLYKTEKRAFLPYLLISPVLFIAGASLVFYFIFPFVMEFALRQQAVSDTQSIELLTKIAEYLKLATTLFLAFGMSFQLPVILSLLGRAGIIRAETLKVGRKYALLGIAVFAAFVTPPDPFSQFILIIAIYLLYEVSILSVSILQKKADAPSV